MLRVFLTVLLCAVFTFTNAQNAGFSVNYENNLLRNTVILSITQDSLNNIYFQTYNGIIKYDSYNWKFFNLNQKIFKALCSDTTIIIAGEKDIFLYNPKRDTIYIAFKLPENQDYLFNTIRDSNNIIFVYDGLLVYFNSETQQFSSSKVNFMINGAVNYLGKLLLMVPGYGLSDTSGNLIIPLENDGNIIFSVELGDKVLLAFDNNKLFWLQNYSATPFHPDFSPYIKKHFITNALQLNDSILAISTQTGGVILFNIKTNKTYNLLTNLNALPDNEISAIYADADHNLWVAHSFGITMLDFNLGLKNYTYISGLNGTPTYIYQNDTTLLAGTTNGLYYLTKPSSSELLKLITIKQPSSAANISTSTQVSSTQSKPANIFQFVGRLFKKRKRNTTEQDQKQQDQENVTIQPKKNKVKVVKKTVISDSALFFQNQYTLIFKKVPGINTKIKKILASENSTYAVTSNSVYLLSQQKTKKIIQAPYIIDASLDNFLAILEQNTLILYNNGAKYAIELPEDNYTSIALQGNVIWVGSYGKVLRILVANNLKPIQQHTFQLPGQRLSPVTCASIKNKTYLITPSALFTVIKDTFYIERKFNNAIIFSPTSQNLWLLNNTWLPVDSSSTNLSSLLNLFDNVSNIFTYKNFSFIIANNNQIYRVTNNFKTPELNIKLYIKNITPKFQKYLEYSQIKDFFVLVACPFFYKPNSCQYRYGIKTKNSIHWSGWKNYNEFSPPLNKGNNTLLFQAKTPLGLVTNTVELKVKVKPPFTQTIGFYILVYFALVALIAIFFILRQKQLKRRNELLEQMVRERTAQIEAQKEELRQQNEEIRAQRDQIEEQFRQISLLHQELTDSIKYAQRIQAAILPSTDKLEQFFDENFIIYLPRDVVSGDFYWWREIGNKIVVAVADCTGHGVPGAFLTIMGTAFLNEITASTTDPDPGHILNQLRQMVVSALTKDNEQLSDGMDISIIVFDKISLSVKFAGAYNSAYIVRENQLIELKAQRMPVGKHPLLQKNIPFQTQTFEAQKQDIIYLFSDGFQDQFGGGNGKTHKFTKTNFKKLLLSVSEFCLDEQKKLILDVFLKWKGSNRQTDDVTILGLKI